MNTRINPIRALIVDDSEVEFALLSAFLSSVRSLKVIGFANDGFEAICYLRGVEPFKDRKTFPYPDLVFLDYNMPRRNGMDVLRFLQWQPRRPGVVLWSSSLDSINVPLALQLGADLVCRKPMGSQELIKIVRHLETEIFNVTSFLDSPKKLVSVYAPA